MKLSDKNILLVSPESWGHIFVSKHHYAVHLSKAGNKVFYLNPPSGRSAVRRSGYERLWVVDYKGFPRGIRFYPSFLQRRVISAVFQELQRQCGEQFDIIWSFDNSVFFDFSALPADVLKITHIVDFNQDFQTKKAAATANCCLCITERIRQRLSRYNRAVHKINHGYSNRPGRNVPVLPDMRGRVKAVYAGNLDLAYIDWHLLDAIILGNTAVEFFLVGPYSLPMPDAMRVVAGRPNVHFTGAVNASDLPAWYAAADVLLIAYREKFHAGQVENTHKMMEYLGSGKVVVATYTAEYAGLPEDMVVMTRYNQNFPMRFADVVANLNHWNSDTLQQARRSFALNNTYEKQIERIEEIIRGL